MKLWVKWLYPGLKIKRWLLLAFLGLIVLIAGLSVLNDAVLLGMLLKTVVSFMYSFWGSSLSWYIGLTLMGLGTFFIIKGFKETMNSLFNVLLPDKADRLVEILYQKRSLKKGPKIVAIGGGTGLPTLLRGLKSYTSNITALVTMSDDGGSSGRLRGEFGMLAPGDTRNCLVALADTESLMEQVLNYRFDHGEGLTGHSLGNLLLTSMTEITGDIDEAIKELSKVLAIRGRVIPSTLDATVLCAELSDGSVVRGESKIPDAKKKIQRVFLEPQNAKLHILAYEAIKEADIIILGPGSLYTSIIPNLLVEGMVKALSESKAPVVYICNVMTQPGETDYYTVSDHLQAIIDHTQPKLINYIIANTEMVPHHLLRKYRLEGAYPVVLDKKAVERLHAKLIAEKLINKTNVVRHDPEELARLVINKALTFKKNMDRVKLFDFTS
jgi:uncharacterized cofD-like protein